MSSDRTRFTTNIEKSAIVIGDHGTASVVTGRGADGPDRSGDRRKGVFVNYRREDTAHAAGRLGDVLSRRNPDLDVFVDVHSIRPATDFLTSVRRSLSSSFLVLALIGDNWLQPQDGQSRLSRPEDYVRRELELAIAGGLVILPVLVDVARLPDARQVPASVAPLLRRHAVSLRHEEFAADADHICEIVRREYEHRS
jgi:hypothetical protein